MSHERQSCLARLAIFDPRIDCPDRLRSWSRSKSRWQSGNSADAEREYAYDRHSSVGHLDVALDVAALNKWTVVDMKNDWKIIYPFEKK